MLEDCAQQCNGGSVEGQKVARSMSKEMFQNAILLCWESFNVRCHRRLVAEWLEANLGIVVAELDHERSESIPFSEQPSKWETNESRASGAQAL